MTRGMAHDLKHSAIRGIKYSAIREQAPLAIYSTSRPRSEAQYCRINAPRGHRRGGELVFVRHRRVGYPT